jgi:hypothetical protein
MRIKSLATDCMQHQVNAQQLDAALGGGEGSMYAALIQQPRHRIVCPM